MNRRTIIVVAVCAVVAAAITTLALRGPGSTQQATTEGTPVKTDALVRVHSPSLGKSTAPVTVVEFIDPACEGCRAFYPHVKRILAEHPDEARLVIRYVTFHGAISVEGVRILESARRQGLFERVLDALMEAQPLWASHAGPDAAKAWEVARGAGLNMDLAREYVSSGAVDLMLEQEMADVRAVKIEQTPTFFVNGQELENHHPDGLRQMIQQAAAGSGGAQ